MRFLHRFIYIAAAFVLLIPSSSTAAEPILLADTADQVVPAVVGGVASIGDSIVFLSSLRDVDTLHSADRAGVVDLMTADMERPILSGGPGLAIVSGVAPLEGLMTNGTVSGTYPVAIGERAFGPHRLGDRWVFYDVRADNFQLWSTDGDGESVRVPVEVSSPDIALRDTYAFVVGYDCAVFSTDGSTTHPRTGPPAGEFGPRPLPCRMFDRGDEVLLVPFSVAEVWETEGDVRLARQVPYIFVLHHFARGTDGYFFTQQSRLFFSDGSETGTVPIQRFQSTITLDGATQLGEHLVFQPTGTSLWISDGTEAGTSRYVDSVPSGPFVSRGEFIYWITDSGETWRMNSSLDAELVGTFPVSPDGRLAATSQGLVAWNARSIWLLPDGAAAEQIWPDARPATTVGAHPRSFVASDSSVYFLSPESEVGRFGSWWRTKGTPESTRQVDGLPRDASMLARLAGDRVLIRGAGRFLILTNDGRVLEIDDQREFADSEFVMDTPVEVLAGPRATFLVNTVYANNYIDLVVSRVTDTSVLKSIARIRLATPDTLETFVLWLRADNHLTVTTPTCREWRVSPSGEMTFRELEVCRVGPRVELPSGWMERRRDGLWYVNGDLERGFQNAVSGIQPAALGDRAYYIRRTDSDSREPNFELAETDGTVDGTRTAFRAEGADNSVAPDFLEVHRGVLYFSTTQPRQVFGLTAGGEVVAITPHAEQGAFTVPETTSFDPTRPPSSSYAKFLGNRLIYAGADPRVGEEPFAVEIPTDDPDSFLNSSPGDGALGCSGCSNGPGNPLGALGLVGVAALVAVRRRFLTTLLRPWSP